MEILFCFLSNIFGFFIFTFLLTFFLNYFYLALTLFLNNRHVLFLLFCIFFYNFSHNALNHLCHNLFFFRGLTLLHLLGFYLLIFDGLRGDLFYCLLLILMFNNWLFFYLYFYLYILIIFLFFHLLNLYILWFYCVILSFGFIFFYLFLLL